MSLHGVQSAWAVGHDRPAAIRFGTRRWRRVHMAIGDKQHVCPYCGAACPDKRARILHEMWEARVQLLMWHAGIIEAEEGE